MESVCLELDVGFRERLYSSTCWEGTAQDKIPTKLTGRPKRMQSRKLAILFGVPAFPASTRLLCVTHQQSNFKTKTALIICRDLLKMKSPWSYCKGMREMIGRRGHQIQVRSNTSHSFCPVMTVKEKPHDEENPQQSANYRNWLCDNRAKSMKVSKSTE